MPAPSGGEPVHVRAVFAPTAATATSWQVLRHPSQRACVGGQRPPPRSGVPCYAVLTMGRTPALAEVLANGASAAFEQFDTEMDGSITSGEIRSLCGALNVPPRAFVRQWDVCVEAAQFPLRRCRLQRVPRLRRAPYDFRLDRAEWETAMASVSAQYAAHDPMW